MTSRRKVLVSAAVVVAVGVLAALGTYGAFTATTSNTGNSISSGTVALTDTDGGSGRLISLSGGAPNAYVERCIQVQYTGSLASEVKLYRGALSAGTGDDYHLDILRGTMPSPPDQNMSCTGFSETSAAYGGDLGDLGTTYAGGRYVKTGTVTTGQAQVLMFQTFVKDDATANAHTQSNNTGAFDVIFEAQSL